MNALGWFLLGGAVALAVIALVAWMGAGRRTAGLARAPSLAGHQPQEAEAWAIIERVAEGLVVLDERLQPVAANTAARALLGLPADSLPPRLPSDEIRGVARRSLDDGAGAEEVVSLWYPAYRSLKVRAEPLDEGGGAVVVLEDVTEELRTQRIRREFVAHASHELKSPVASMQTLAEALRQAVDDDPEAAARFSDRIVFESARLGRLIAALLDLSRLEDPQSLPDEGVDVGAAAESAVDDVTGEAQSKRISIKTNLGIGVWVRGHEAQLNLLVRNLVENAIRYTQEGGTVHVYVRQEGGTAVVRVSDNGMGIPLEAQGRVFERFFRVDKARSRDKGGTGLGLAIVKHVAELHGGTVELESELGRGSTFTARLPTMAAPAPPARSATG